MKGLSISVAIAAMIALVAGITQGGVGFLGLAADLTLLSSGVVGLALALVTLRSPSISAFLRVFSTIFAVEYVLTGLAYVIVRVGWWPASLADAAPPVSLPITVAIFTLLVYLVSFFPVIRQITRLADPYFAMDDRRDVRVAGLGRRRMMERHFATALTVMLVVINQLQVAINVRLSFFNRDWFNAIQNKDPAAFWSLLFGVFCFWAAIAVVSHLVEYYVESATWRAGDSVRWKGRPGVFRRDCRRRRACRDRARQAGLSDPDQRAYLRTDPLGLPRVRSETAISPPSTAIWSAA